MYPKHSKVLIRHVYRIYLFFAPNRDISPASDINFTSEGRNYGLQNMFVDSEKKADLIVIMTYGSGRFKKEFIGSVAEKVIQEAHCPVITMTP